VSHFPRSIIKQSAEENSRPISAMAPAGRICWSRAARRTKKADPALLQGRRPVTPSGGAGCGARGQGLVTFAPGRFGHHACRHYDRRARCSLRLGTALAARPPRLVRVFQEAWPELRLRDDDSLRSEPRWNAGRCAASPVRVGQCRSPQGCGGYGTASYGVPLPFAFFVARVERSETRERRQSRAVVPGFRFAQSGLRPRIRS
jgi:hypothetical protein